MAKRTFSPEQKREILASVKADIKSGMTVDDACKRQGIHSSQWYGWNGRGRAQGAVSMTVKRKKKAEPTMAILPVGEAVTPNGKVFLFHGSPEQIAELVRRLA